MPPSKEKTAELIKSQRLAKGFTQQQLAELTRVSLRSIQRIENGEVIPRAYTLTILAEHLDFDPQSIRSSTNPNNTETVLKSNKAKRIIFLRGWVLSCFCLAQLFYHRHHIFLKPILKALSFGLVSPLPTQLSL